MSEDPLSARLRAAAEPVGMPWGWVGLTFVIAVMTDVAARSKGHESVFFEVIAIFAMIHAWQLRQQLFVARKALNQIADEFESVGR